MILVVGLGNPGDTYEHTRHNVGWRVLNAFIETQTLPSLVHSGAYHALLSQGMWGGKEITMLLPSTFMNNSGSSVVRYSKDTNPEQIIVVHDDIDLPLGEVKVSIGRGSGGHNGVQSLILSLGNKDFVRVRVGIGHKNIFGIMRRPRGDALSKFVLDPFTKKEEKELEAVDKKVLQALALIVTKGVAVAMQECN